MIFDTDVFALLLEWPLIPTSNDTLSAVVFDWMVSLDVVMFDWADDWLGSLTSSCQSNPCMVVNWSPMMINPSRKYTNSREQRERLSGFWLGAIVFDWDLSGRVHIWLWFEWARSYLTGRFGLFSEQQIIFLSFFFALIISLCMSSIGTVYTVIHVTTTVAGTGGGSVVVIMPSTLCSCIVIRNIPGW